MKRFAQSLLLLLLLLALCACTGQTAQESTSTSSEHLSVEGSDTDTTEESTSDATQTDTTLPCTHSFGEWETITEAKEGEAGLKKRLCTLCGDEETEPIPALPVHVHNYTETVYLSNCEEDGFTLKTCEDCGHSEQADVVKASGHKYGNWEVNIPASYEDEGEDIRTCSVCGDKDTRTVGKLQVPPNTHVHKYTTTVFDVTCTEDGYTEQLCSCGRRIFTIDATATGHSFGEWYTTLHPMGMYGGLERRDCGNCGDAEMRTLPPGGHPSEKPEEEDPEISTDPEASDVSFSGSCSGSYTDTDGGPDDTEDSDTPEDLPVREFTYYNQRDKRWGNKELGCGTMKNNGCGPSSIAIALSYYGIDVTPYDVALWLYENTIEFNHTFHGISATGIKLGLEHYGRKVVPIGSYEEFQQHLRNGAVVVGAQGKGHFVSKQENSHCIVMFGLDGAGKVQCYDPYTERLNGLYTAESLWEERSRKEVDVRYEGVTHFAVY
ncbi:MAG: C39 family peptidase [Clostridia bacterium]|nr:C39 family peptidase [Clostridia bacterium]